MDKSIVKNYLYSLSYQILLILAPLITSPYVSRVLHADGIGVYSYTYTIAVAFSLFAALGVNGYGQREIAYRSDDAEQRSIVFYELMIVRLVMTVIVAVAYIAMCVLYGEYTAYLVAEIFVVVAVLPDASWFFQGMEDFKVIAIRNVVVRLSTIAAIFLFVRTEQDVLTYILIISLSAFVGNLLYLPYLRKYLVAVPTNRLRPQNHIRGTIEFFIPLLAVQLYSHLDRIMLGALAGSPAENGYYEQARKIVSLAISVVTSLSTVLCSRISHLYAKGDTESVVDSNRSSFRVIMMLSLPIAVGLFVVSDNFVLWFFGNDFEPVSFLLKLSCPMLIFMCIGNFAGMQYLIPTGQQNKMTAIYVVSAVLNIVLNLFLIPIWSAAGALLASIAAEACSCGLQVALLKRSEYNFKMLAGAWRYVVASSVMAAVLIALQMLGGLVGPLETIVEVFAGMAVYGIALIAMKDPSMALLISTIRYRIGKEHNR